MEPNDGLSLYSASKANSKCQYRPIQQKLSRRFLDCYLFDSLGEEREITDEWVEDYNYFKSQDALVGLHAF